MSPKSGDFGLRWGDGQGRRGNKRVRVYPIAELCNDYVDNYDIISTLSAWAFGLECERFAASHTTSINQCCG
jgi:hypothetical protein